MFDHYSSAPPTTPLPFYSPLHLQQQHQGVNPSLSLPIASDWDKPKPFYTPLTSMSTLQSQPFGSGIKMWVHKFREQQREQQRKSLEKRTTEGPLPQPTKPKTATPTAPSLVVTFVLVSLHQHLSMHQKSQREHLPILLPNLWLLTLSQQTSLQQCYKI